MTRTVEIEHGGHAFEVDYWVTDTEFTLHSIRPSAGVPHQYGGDISDWLIDHAWDAYNQIEAQGIQAIFAEDEKSKTDAIALAREAMDD